LFAHPLVELIDYFLPIVGDYFFVGDAELGESRVDCFFQFSSSRILFQLCKTGVAD
jgi:hypothetical protein